MKTVYFSSDDSGAGALIRNGGLVAVPTETVYGLAGNGLDPDAVARIYEVKGRPSVKPLSLMVTGKEAMTRYCEDVPPEAELLAERFWPGPLTIVLKSRDCVPDIVRAGGATVGLRCPDCEPTLAALREAGVPFAAPSANPSGQPSPKFAEAVKAYFDGVIDGIIDGGECTIGTESTIIAMDTVPYRILRQGAVSPETIADVLADDMTVIGITGPSGCGKSTALEMVQGFFAEGKCFCADCDALYHTMLENDAELNADILREFPEAQSSSADRFPRVDRSVLGKIVFSDHERLLKLNSVTHAHLSVALRSLLREQAMNGAKLFVIDASELIGSGADELCDCIISVLSSYEKRLERILARDGITEDAAVARIRAQHDDEHYISASDVSIRNDGTVEEFRCRLAEAVSAAAVPKGNHMDLKETLNICS